jgi:endo-1,4-beta-xylanase
LNRSIVKFGLLGIAAVFLIALLHQSSVSADDLLESFDAGTTGWAVSRGGLNLDSSDKREGRSAAVWRFDYPKDAVFLFTKSRLEKFEGAKGISFWMKSDRDGALFLRFDQKGGAPYILPFQVGTEWEQHSFQLDEFQPAGRGNRLDSSKLTAFYIVDLAGKDNGARGSRSVWVDGITVLRDGGKKETASASGGEPAVGGENKSESNPLAPIFGNRPRRTANLVLRAWDAEGAPLSAGRWKSQGTSAGEYVFISDLQGVSIYGKTSSRKEAGVDTTTVETDDSRPVAVNALFWEVPGYGKVWLRADNEGKGFSGGQTLHMNYELAASKLAAVLQSETGRTQDAPGRLARAKDLLSRAAKVQDDREKARIANEALSLTMRVAEEMELDAASDNIEKYRKGAVRVTVRQGGRAVRGAKVRYRQTRSQTLFGCIQSFGFIDQKLKQSQRNRVADLMRDAGFNHFTVSLFWDRTEPKPGQYDLDEWDEGLGLDAFRDRGFTFTGHAIVQAALPPHVKKAGPARFAELAERHMDRLMGHYEKKYPGKFLIWQAVNEPSSNRFVGLSADAKLDMIRRVTQRIRENAPKALVEINDYNWDRGQRHKANFLMPDVREMYSTLEYFQGLKRAVGYDVMGLQWYPGLRVIYGGGIIDLSEPLMDLGMSGEQWDRYGALGKPLHITEMAVPGRHEKGWSNGYWKAPWTPQIQADYMRNVYTLAYSKPYIKEITYWGISDHEPWAIHGGMLDKNWEPKPLYSALKSLLQSWRTTGEGTTDGNGNLEIRGYGGDYELQIESGGKWKTVSLSIEEGKQQARAVEI